jgi:hypothetical protein
MVAEEKLSYAKACRKSAKVEKQAAVQQCSNMCSHVCRADVIDTPNSDQYSLIPTAVRKNWAVSRKPAITSTVETQTDDEPVETAVQTSADAATQTIEMVDEAVQQSVENETQTPAIDNEKEAEEQYFIVTLLQIVGALMPFSEARSEVEEWSELVEKFNFIAGKMATRGYPVKLASAAVRRSVRQTRQYQPNRQYYEPYCKQ